MGNLNKTKNEFFSSKNSNSKIDLFDKMPFLKKIVKSRIFQLLLILPNLFVFYVVIVAGIFGSPVGNRNLSIVLIWIFWWFLLISILVPFFGRLWCAMCPLPFFGDILQRLSFINVRIGKTRHLRNKMFGLNKKWPKYLTNIWIPNITFLALCSFSAILVTRPFVSSLILASMFLAATVLAYFYSFRIFCRHVCPVSGFIGLYSKASMIELRSKDQKVCLKCKDKGCIKGNEKGWGCPWNIYMGNLERSNDCGLCMECVKTCPNDNIGLNVRSFSSENNIKGYDEAWKAFIDVGTSHAYSMIYLGASGMLKDWVNMSESGNWSGFFIYLAGLWLISLVLVPAIFYLISILSIKLTKLENLKTKDVFLGFSNILIPLGLLAWIAFSVPLILINGSYVVSVISDPFGWGWNLFGTASFKWQPVLPNYLGLIQIGLLMIGLAFSLRRGIDIANKLFKTLKNIVLGFLPFAIFVTLITIIFIIFFIG